MQSKNEIVFSPTISFALILIIIATICISCKKKEGTQMSASNTSSTAASPTTSPTNTVVIDTIRPSNSYLPAYPGSYWVYKINGGPATSTNAVSLYYVKDSLWSNSNKAYSTKAMVPVYNKLPLWWYGYYVTAGNTGPKIVPWFYNGTIAKGHTWYEETLGYGLQRVFLTADTSIIVNGLTYNHVVCVREYISEKLIYGGGFTSDCYYAKDIGIIKKYTFNYRKDMITNPFLQIPMDSVKDVYELSSYFINKR